MEKSHYINRELSHLAFCRRVCAQARNLEYPLLERLRFVFICSQLLDEFFEIRVARLKEISLSDSEHTTPDGLSAEKTLQAISEQAHELVNTIYSIFNHELTPELKKEKIYFIHAKQWDEKIKSWANDYFSREILPVLSPIGLDLAHPFPRLLNKGLNFIVSMRGKDAFGRSSGLAIVHAPRVLARLIKLPEELSNGNESFIPLSTIIRAHADQLFPGMKIEGCYQFRVTRNSDLFVDEEEIEDLANSLRSELPMRRYGSAVRLEISESCPPHLAEFLLQKHGLTEGDLYRCKGAVNLSRFMSVLEMLERSDLRFPHLIPATPSELYQQKNIFDLIDKKDILLHHPFEAFHLIIQFIQQAARDKNVIAIKQTLYRIPAESKMVDALIDAALAGKQVTVIVELRARFDEASNIDLAERLQKAGAIVLYGVVGFKTHAKLSLVVRRSGNRLRRYAHLSTGNYHEHTAKVYTDFALLTSQIEMTTDVHHVFQMLSGIGEVPHLKKIILSPFNLNQFLLHKIKREIKLAKSGKVAIIRAKINGLTDPHLIQALYKASQAGVKIDLIVRGICCLVPAVDGVSDNITVRSIVGRFLEHSRVYYFYANGKEQVYCSSADWMERNLHHRVETCFPIEDATAKRRIIEEGIENYLSDQSESWHLQENAHYQQAARARKKSSAQQKLLKKFLNKGKKLAK